MAATCYVNSQYGGNAALIWNRHDFDGYVRPPGGIIDMGPTSMGLIGPGHHIL